MTFNSGKLSGLKTSLFVEARMHRLYLLEFLNSLCRMCVCVCVCVCVDDCSNVYKYIEMRSLSNGHHC